MLADVLCALGALAFAALWLWIAHCLANDEPTHLSGRPERKNCGWTSSVSPCEPDDVDAR